MALMDLGIKASSYTGAQVRILTDSAYTKARILKIDEDKIRADLDAGMSWWSRDSRASTRPATSRHWAAADPTRPAVALAAALNADECQIYTDVDGVYTTDPRIVPEARRL